MQRQRVKYFPRSANAGQSINYIPHTTQDNTMTTLKQTTFNTLNIEHNGEWCNVMWRQVGGSGGRYRMIILSSYGNWSYYWVTGSSDFPRWLAGLSFDYLGHKLFEGDFYTYDNVATNAGLVEELLAARRRGDVDLYDTRDLYDRLQCHDIEYMEFWTTDALNFIENREEFEVKSACKTWKCFWKFLWEPAVIPALRALSEQTEAA